MNATTRELTLKEKTTKDFQSKLDKLVTKTGGGIFGSNRDRAEIEAIEAELEERSEYEQKVSRW